MNDHVPEDLLDAFVEGQVNEHLATHIAEHLDRCPRCLNRVTALEPMSPVFAAASDPEIPSGLVQSILEEANAPSPRPTVEIALGGTLLILASLLTLAQSSLLESMAYVAVLADSLAHLSTVLLVNLSGYQGVMTLMTLAAAAGVWATQRYVSGTWTALPVQRRVS